jgi:multicomponent K+:H+ antiporter subunit G
MNQVPFWVEAMVAALLASSGVFVVISALGFLRLPDFFQRMHPPALAYTIGSWCVALAGILRFSALESRAVLHPWLIVVVLCVTVPVTTLVLARVALFRRRAAGSADTPPPLTPPRGSRLSPPISASAQPNQGEDPR